MSKSLGNFVTIADVLKDWPGEVVRLNMLRTHYRQPIDWRLSALQESKTILEGWIAALERHQLSFLPSNRDYYEQLPLPLEIEAALSDDINISGAVAEMHKLAKGNGILDGQKLLASLLFLGIVRLDGLEEKLAILEPNEMDLLGRDKIIRLIENRLAARHLKNWAESDRIRDELDAMGIAIKDNKDGTTTWEVKR